MHPRAYLRFFFFIMSELLEESEFELIQYDEPRIRFFNCHIFQSAFHLTQNVVLVSDLRYWL